MKGGQEKEGRRGGKREEGREEGMDTEEPHSGPGASALLLEVMGRPQPLARDAALPTAAVPFVLR